MWTMARWRDELAARPEWWIVGLGLVSWIWLLREGLMREAHHWHHQASVGADLFGWQVMVLAMMLPALTMKARDVALRSYEDRRHEAVATFLVSYLVTWSIVGTMAIALLRWLSLDPLPATVALCAMATAWAVLPLRDRAMMRLYAYAPIIAPDGWRLVRDCARAGFTIGAMCVASCLPLMLACLASGHDVVLVAAGGAIALIERKSFRPPRRLVISASAALTLLVSFGL